MDEAARNRTQVQLSRIGIDALGERRSFLDPHSGQEGAGRTVKSGLARAAIVDIARDQYNRIWVLDAWAGRVGTEQMVDELIKHWQRWHSSPFGIEAAGQQKLFVDTVRMILRMRGLNIPIDGREPSTREKKVFRIRRVIQPVVAEQRLLINKELVELKTEMAQFPTGQTMDIVDALAGAIDMLPVMATGEELHDQGDELYAEFLREQGLTNDQIERKLREAPDETAIDDLPESGESEQSAYWKWARRMRSDSNGSEC